MNHQREFFFIITVALARFLFGLIRLLFQERIISNWVYGKQVRCFTALSQSLPLALWGTLSVLCSGIIFPLPFHSILPSRVVHFISAGCAVVSDPTLFFSTSLVRWGIETTVAASHLCFQIAPPEYQGKLGGLCQFNIVFRHVCVLISLRTAW